MSPASRAVVILLGDQPRLSSAAIRKVIDAFHASGSPIVRARWRGAPGPPVVVARSEWPSFGEVEGDKGARDLISASAATEEVEMDEPPPVDIDTWEQYDALRREGA